MNFIGVDLAWGDRNPTGLAVLDRDGRLVHVSAVRSDDEIVTALTPYAGDECLVAVDAPLVVVNPTGNRPAEALLNRDFATFDAGAHPSNTGKPEFRGQPRGARIAGRLGLDMNPRSGRRRRAIEVYPHPATVVLFRLGRTLKYKQRSGRDIEQLRGELLVLIGLLEGLAEADPPLRLTGDAPGAAAWEGLRRAAERAGRKSELRVVEDQVDAVVCAYVAMFADRRPERTTTYGDFETGYVVTPTLLDEAGINYLTVTGRAKSVASYAAKVARTVDGRPVYPDPQRDITDQIGLRVITYVHSDVQAVVDLLDDQVAVHDDRDLGEETASEGRFGYASRHLLVGLHPEQEGRPEHRALRGRQAQVQIRTVLQHAWAEFEHDIRYKGSIPEEHVSEFDRRFTLAAGLLELADREFTAIRDRLREGTGDQPAEPEDDDPRLSPRDLAAFLAGQYPDAGWSRTEHYAWIARTVLELGITSLKDLGEIVRPVDTATLMERMDYRYPPGAVRRLDDALLWALGERYVELQTNRERVDALRSRLARMRPPT